MSFQDSSLPTYEPNLQTGIKEHVAMVTVPWSTNYWVVYFSSIWSKLITSDYFPSVADFREVIRGLHQGYGSVQHLAKVETQTWREFVQPNACYIFQEMLQGLNYLYHNNIQHGDLKG